MKITHLQVIGLFGLYDYKIDFSCEGENFTVLTSPNGYGKTTLLRIINSLHVQRLYFLYILKFNEMTIKFDDGTELYAQKTGGTGHVSEKLDTLNNERRVLSLEWRSNQKVISKFVYTTDIVQYAKQLVSRRYYARSHYHYDLTDFDDEYFIEGELGEYLNNEIAQKQNQEQFLLQLAAVQTDFIGANRIYLVHKDLQTKDYPSRLPILQVVKELRDKLSFEVSEFQKNFQRLDSKLIDMLLGEKGHEIDEAEYNRRAGDLIKHMDELASFGLTNKQTMPPYDANNARTLDVYLNLMVEKMSYYKDLIPLMKLFNEKASSKSFANKIIKLSPQHGLRIEADNGDILRADTLSTGEQNQLVLLYDLVFKTPKSSILLIDEPENSLHVAWQNDFVKDMQTIANNKDLQIIVATHSPIIVSNTPREKVYDLFYLQSS